MNWQFDKKIPVTAILSICGLLVAFGIGWGKIAEQQSVDARQDTDLQRMRIEIREDLREINQKLDRLIERRH